MDDEALVDGGDVGDLLADVDDDATEAVGGVDLGHGTLEDGETGDVEALEEDLADALVGGAREAGSDGHDDRRFVLGASELEFLEQDVFPGCMRSAAEGRWGKRDLPDGFCLGPVPDVTVGEGP